jgi:hypothetical protein
VARPKLPVLIYIFSDAENYYCNIAILPLLAFFLAFLLVVSTAKLIFSPPPPPPPPPAAAAARRTTAETWCL